MVSVNKVNWFLTESEEQLLIINGITDVVSRDMLMQAQDLYDAINKGFFVPSKMATDISSDAIVIADITDIYPLVPKLPPDETDTIVDIPATEVRCIQYLHTIACMSYIYFI